MHVHSQFSDGANSLEENFEAAKAAGLTALGCVDHVRRSTTWVPDYLAAVDKLRGRGIDITAGVEATLLDASGRIDIPDDVSGVDLIYIADHRFPGDGQRRSPAQVRAELANGTTTPMLLIETLVCALERAIARYPAVVIAHLFSVLPKVGLDERDVPQWWISRLATVAQRYGAAVEIDERWRCPSARTLQPFVDRGVRIVASTDSHRAASVGQYTYVAQVAAALGAE